MNRVVTGQEWRINRQTHQWVTLNGEDYACNDCDTRTGLEPCPGSTGNWHATKTERETPGTGILNPSHYEYDPDEETP